LAATQWAKKTIDQVVALVHNTNSMMKDYECRNPYQKKQLFITQKDNKNATPLLKKLPRAHYLMMNKNTKAMKNVNSTLNCCQGKVFET